MVTNSSTKPHTPGPWRYEIWGGADFQQGVVESVQAGLVVCNIPKFDVINHGQIAVADARLIAAAPDLLAAAKDAFLALPMTKHNEPINAALKAAIAKAESGAA